MKKQYKLESITSGELFRVEICLNKIVGKDKFTLDKDKSLLTIDCGDEEFEKVKEEINKINEDIELN